MTARAAGRVGGPFATSGREPASDAEISPEVTTPMTLDAPTMRAPDEAAPAALVLGRYRLERRLGTGGFGAVWLAHDEKLGREVAVKAVPRSAAHDDRAEREAVAAARLNHPGIVTLYEAGSDASGHYLVSELVSGATLADLQQAGALSDRDVVRIGIALADALEHAHERGVVHRDVKPQNVIVPDVPQSPAGVAKLTDFGIALLVGDEPLTRTGDVVGTLAYMAPEQAEGRRVGPATDVYALGLVLYEALSGGHPVRGASPAATARRLGAVLPSLGRARRDLPGPLVAAVDRALRPRPEERGAPADLRAALAEATEEVSDEGGRLALPAPARRLPRGSARVGAALAAGGLALLATTLAGPAGQGAAGRALPAGASPGTADAITVAGALPVAPLLAAAMVSAAVFLLPRLGWLAAALGLVVALAAPPVSAAGLALVVGAGLLACPLLLRRSGRVWSAPALAPLLGVASVAAGWCALAGQARGPYRRAALGALGFWWLSLAEPLLGRTLHLGPSASLPPTALWAGSARDAAADVVWPLLSGGALAGAGVWAVAALALPWLVRGWRLLADGVAAAGWAAALAAADGAVAALAHPAAPVSPHGGLAGPALAAALAVALRWARGPDPPRLPAA
ncbi:MAG: eukaryotic-like serine/threonine-protein kinase [Solirubrobacteraceae bacterium]|nr:eukaryotic-like serine/threonine-protein kinase [Solirubrobacteraceae bacterium]